MSLPVGIHLRIKLLRDLPELQSDHCPASVGPDAADMHHTIPKNTIDTFVTESLRTTQTQESSTRSQLGIHPNLIGILFCTINVMCSGGKLINYSK